MGWKNLKERFNIGHIVCVRDGDLLVGSGYIPDLIVIGMDGVVKKAYGGNRGFVYNLELIRVQQAIDANPVGVREAVTSPDSFAAALPVYTYDGGTIIEEYCEAYGWPNVTHTGHLMYDNSYFKNKWEAVERAKQNLAAGMRFRRDRIAELETELVDQRNLLSQDEGDLANLYAEYPEPVHCPVCGTALDEDAVIVTAAGKHEWMCNVCGETGLVEEPVTVPPAARPLPALTGTAGATPPPP